MDNTAVVNSGQIKGNLNLSAEFHVNRQKGRKPYIKWEGQWIEAHDWKISNSH